MLLLNEPAHRAARAHPEHELRDFCGLTAADIHGDAKDESPEMLQALSQPLEGNAVAHGGRVLKVVKGMGTVFDWRGTQWTLPMVMGGLNPLSHVVHIPVLPDMAGIADFIKLRDVLVAQGLGIHQGTDRTGNVALFLRMTQMTYQAKGGNQLTIGTENMHLTVTQEWTKRQMRAQAWIINQAKDHAGISAHWGSLASGPGVIRVRSRGNVSHKMVANAAGFHNRSDPGVKGLDPGGKYDKEYVYHCVVGYRQRIKDGTADKLGMEGL